MSTETQPITAEQLWQMPQDRRRELVRGEVREMSPSGFDHGAIVVNLSALLAAHVKQHRLGVVVGGEAGFLLSRNPDIVRGVDVGFVRASRIPASGRPIQYWNGAPDLAVEVVSPSDRFEEIEEKIGDYLAAGTLMVWVINPRARTVTVHRPGIPAESLTAEQRLEGYDVVPGFQCTVSSLFD